jgi:hypothetical protein
MVGRDAGKYIYTVIIMACDAMIAANLNVLGGNKGTFFYKKMPLK